MYFLPVVISDNDYPIQSSTSTLIVRVCACDSRGNMQSCSPEVLPFSDGLTTGALVAILLCVIILLSKSPGVYEPVYVNSVVILVSFLCSAMVEIGDCSDSVLLFKSVKIHFYRP